MTSIAQFYSALHRGYTGDISFYKSICKDAAHVLELGCGNGRMTMELAQVCQHITGLDEDPDMLALAREQMEKKRLHSIELICSDMAILDLAGPFDRIVIPFTTAFCLSRPRLQACLRRCAERLSTEGILALDVYPAEIFHDSEVSDVDYELIETIDVAGVRYAVSEKTSVRRNDKVINVTYRNTPKDPKSSSQTVEYTIEHHYVLMDEWPDLLKNAGFCHWEFYGDFNGAGVHVDADRFVILASL
ncbi:MAG: class I SAM-dependent methyltransferase [Myxococcota bacterium]|nr:class I SAM-dependent methyltransferase [Myxococcota bacterium]